MGRLLYVSFVAAVLILTMVPLISGIENIGTKKLDDCMDLIQACADCTYVNFTSYTMPNGTRDVVEWSGVQDGVSFTYNSCDITSQLGEWIIDGHGDDEGTDRVFSYKYVVTITGNETPVGMPTFQMGVIIIIFAISCFLLFLSGQMNEVGFKIFFLITSFIFLMSALLTAYMVSTDGNVSTAISTTTLSLIWVLGMILIIIFIYFLIRQTINALDLYRLKRGHEWSVPAGASVGGYNTNRAY